MKSIKEILMERDGMSEEEAIELINEAKEEASNTLINNGTFSEIEAIVEDYFGLEPDYVFDIIDI